MSMPFRSHLARSLDFRRRSNQTLAAIVVLAGAGALVLWLGGEPVEVFLAPVHAFLVWAIVREIDPDHQWTALLGAAATAGWVLAGAVVPLGLPAFGLLVAARLMTGTTGRRPLLTDLAGVTVAGIAIGFTVAGWIAGFGVALALYLDDRRSPASRGAQVAASALTAAGATVVAAATGGFPERLPQILPHVAIPAGALALALVGREPRTPTTRVDARYAATLDRGRLHVSRATVAMLVFAMSVLTGADAARLLPLVGALVLVVISNEPRPAAGETR